MTRGRREPRVAERRTAVQSATVSRWRCQSPSGPSRTKSAAANTERARREAPAATLQPQRCSNNRSDSLGSRGQEAPLRSLARWTEGMRLPHVLTTDLSKQMGWRWVAKSQAWQHGQPDLPTSPDTPAGRRSGAGAPGELFMGSAD